MMVQRTRDGVPIDDETWQQLLTAADSVGLPDTEFARLAGQTI
jgi:LDH2 family malate/lactate/ureidoglycolate dehydrogenase